MEDSLGREIAIVAAGCPEAGSGRAGRAAAAGHAPQPGLFAGNAAGKEAAQLCEREGYLRTVRTEPRGKSSADICVISEKGLAYLLGQVNPRPILEAFVQSLDSRQGQFADLLGSVQASQRYLEELKETVVKTLEHFRQAVGSPAAPPLPAKPMNGNGLHKDLTDSDRTSVILEPLRRWRGLGDCPLPELYRAGPADAGWTVGRFHDLLRSLYQERSIYLHPWTGPLYEIPEPDLALLIGHEVAYYASLRGVDREAGITPA